MKNKLTVSAFIATTCLTACWNSAAVAGEFDRTATPWYIGLGVGLQHRKAGKDEAGETRFETGNAFNVTLGRRFNAFRVDGEYSYFKNDNKTTDPTGPLIGKEPSMGDVDIQSYFINVYYDFQIDGSNFSPYIGAGVGRTKAKINGLTTPSLLALPPQFGGPIIVYGESEWETTYQLRLGANYALTQQADLYFGYRYVKGNDLKFDLNDGSVIHPNGIELHNLEVGLRFAF